MSDVSPKKIVEFIVAIVVCVAVLWAVYRIFYQPDKKTTDTPVAVQQEMIYRQSTRSIGSESDQEMSSIARASYNDQILRSEGIEIVNEVVAYNVVETSGSVSSGVVGSGVMSSNLNSATGVSERVSGAVGITGNFNVGTGTSTNNTVGVTGSVSTGTTTNNTVGVSGSVGTGSVSTGSVGTGSVGTGNISTGSVGTGTTTNNTSVQINQIDRTLKDCFITTTSPCWANFVQKNNPDCPAEITDGFIESGTTTASPVYDENVQDNENIRIGYSLITAIYRNGKYEQVAGNIDIYGPKEEFVRTSNGLFFKNKANKIKVTLNLLKKMEPIVAKNGTIYPIVLAFQRRVFRNGNIYTPFLPDKPAYVLLKDQNGKICDKFKNSYSETDNSISFIDYIDNLNELPFGP